MLAGQFADVCLGERAFRGDVGRPVAGPPAPVIASANVLAARLREIGASDTRVVTTSGGTVAVTGTLPSEGWGFAVDAAPAAAADQPLPDSLTLNYFESSNPPRPVDPDAAGDLIEHGLDVARIIVELTGRL